MGGLDDKDKYGIRFTIPDKPIKEQLRMAKSIRKIMLTFAEITGETDALDLSDVDAKIAKLEKKVKAAHKKGSGSGGAGDE